MNKQQKVVEFKMDGSKEGMNVFIKNGQFVGLLWIPSPGDKDAIQTFLKQRGEEGQVMMMNDMVKAVRTLCEAYGVITPNFGPNFEKGHTEKAADRSDSSTPE